MVGMIRQTMGVGVVMVILGVAAYLLTGMVSVTALIPSFFGVVIAGLGLFALKAMPKNKSKPLLIGAMVVSVLGVLGPAGRVLPPLFRGELELGAATVVQIVFAVLAGYLAVVLALGLFKRK